MKVLKSQLKDKIQIVLPLTYGSSKFKKSQIEALFIRSGFDTISYKKKLNLDELCCLRLSADIVLNFQISDAFSASLQEHFFSNSIMILANWLPYEWLKQKGIYFHSINSEEIVFSFTKIMENMLEEKNKSNENKKIISNISAWDIVSKSWCADYRTLMNY